MRTTRVSRGTVIATRSALERWLRATMMLVRRSGFTCRVWAWRSRLVEMVRSISSADNMIFFGWVVLTDAVKWYCTECKESMKRGRVSAR